MSDFRDAASLFPNRYLVLNESFVVVVVWWYDINVNISK